MITAVTDNYPQTHEFGHPTTRLEDHQNSSEELHRLRRENEKLTEIFQFGVWQFEKKNRKIVLLEEGIKERESIIKELQKENEKLQKIIEELKARINLLNKMLFGRKSEKKGAEEAQVVKVTKRRGAVKRHRGHGRKIPENLPVVEDTIDIPEDERFCECCGEPLEEIGLEEVSSEVDVKKIYYLKKIKRKLYKKTCNCPGPIVTAAVPQKLIRKGKFSLGFWVNVLTDKFKNHLPIERQVSDMKEYGLPVPVGTIFGGLKKIHSSYLEPLYKAMAKCLREANHFHVDESGWRLYVVIDGKGNYKWFIWVFVSKDIVLFVLHPTRSAEVPLKALFDIDPDDIKKLKGQNHKEKKRMTVDKFSSYKMLERLGLVELSFCWSHQRREFINLGTKYPELSNWAEEWIKRIGKLYHINNQRIKYDPEDLLFKKYDKKLRKKIDKIYSLITLRYQHPAKASIMNSMKEHWKGLTLFVDNPEIDMDNNISERMLRHMVLGRKNYWGNHSLWAGKLTVAMFSIVETCLLHGISLRAYLTYYLTECAKRGAAPSEDEIEAFLPHKLSEDIRERLRVSKPEGPAPGSYACLPLPRGRQAMITKGGIRL